MSLNHFQSADLDLSTIVTILLRFENNELNGHNHRDPQGVNLFKPANFWQIGVISQLFCPLSLKADIQSARAREILSFLAE